MPKKERTALCQLRDCVAIDIARLDACGELAGDGAGAPPVRIAERAETT